MGALDSGQPLAGERNLVRLTEEQLNPREIGPNDRVSIHLTAQDRELLVEHTFVDPQYVEHLRADSTGRGFVGDYTLDDLEDLIGYVAAEANHAKQKSLARRLNSLFDRLVQMQRSYEAKDGTEGAI